MARPRRISDEVVLAGALRVMFRGGPAEFTLAAVAAEAGIAPPTLVQRFGDKRGLILRALAQDNAEFAAAVAAAPRTRGRSAVIGLFRLLTPEIGDPDVLATDLLWLREDFRDPSALNALARERWRMLREAVAERLPPLPISPRARRPPDRGAVAGRVQPVGLLPRGASAGFRRRLPGSLVRPRRRRPTLSRTTRNAVESLSSDPGVAYVRSRATSGSPA